MNPLHILPTLSAAAIAGIIGGLATQNPVAGAMTAVPSAIVATQVAERKNDKIEREIAQIRSERDKATHKVEKLERVESDLQSSITNIQKQLKIALETARKAQEATVALHDLNSDLECGLAAEKVGLEEAIAERDEALAQLNDYRDSSQSELEVAIADGLDAEYKRQLADIWNQSEVLIQRAIDNAVRFKEWGTGAEQLNGYLYQTADNLETNTERALDRIYETLTNEKRCQSNQITLLNAKLAKLQQEKRGELTEPIYLPRSYELASRVANDIAKELWAVAEMPLEVQGVKTTNGDIKIGFGFSKSIDPSALVRNLNAHAPKIQTSLRLSELGKFAKLDYANVITVTARTEPRIKDSDISHLVGSSDEFIRYVTSNPWRYRLIADPGAGKTPTTAVMVSKMLAAGARMANVPKGKKVPHTLVSVSYPSANSSLKDGDTYPLAAFLKYGDQTQAVKSFGDAIDDYEFRVQNPRYASEFFHLYVWDEFDNTLSDASDPKKHATEMKKLLKQGGHNNIGYIVSGQSVMTKTIPGFMTDDRSLFTEIVIGVNKIRIYLNAYGKGKGSDATLGKLSENMDAIEQYMESKNRLVTDSARELRLALVVAGQSPKLFFLPNFDDAVFDVDTVSNSEALAEEIKGQIASKSESQGGDAKVTENDARQAETITPQGNDPASKASVFSRNGGCASLSDALPHCPTCDVILKTDRKDGRGYCSSCKKTKAQSKFIYK
ncbi:hypothetical protein IQ235_09425 [Oscillatoriales cyanobacterium LEGE 11467]|uniref:Uncharacterized protein n=1 Tax=Zarconia navalis LEGE 11467 TaxID=1828826 RepID=A0A928VVB4_9CYAN|nr:hypothetical protein [Zarconia navalis]MBE9040999.1 hypothetical protein [Zarconia navalis LEGE 11467]